MGAIFKPYLGGLDTTKKLLPRTAGPLQIDTNHPLSRGLVGAYLPGISMVDYTNINGQLNYVTDGFGGACTPVRYVTQEGPAISESGNVQNGAATIAGKLNSSVATWTTTFSVYVRFLQINSTSNGNNGLFYVSDGTHSASGLANVTGAAPSNIYSIFSNAFNSSGAAGAAVSLNVPHGFLCNYLVGPSTSTLWLDGVSYLTSTVATASTCTLTTTFLIISGNVDVAVLAIYFWNRSVTVQDALALESDPYGIFDSPARKMWFASGTPWVGAPDPIQPDIWL